jgi:hypothetical protein
LSIESWFHLLCCYYYLLQILCQSIEALQFLALDWSNLTVWFALYWDYNKNRDLISIPNRVRLNLLSSSCRVLNSVITKRMIQTQFLMSLSISKQIQTHLEAFCFLSPLLFLLSVEQVSCLFHAAKILELDANKRDSNFILCL